MYSAPRHQRFKFIYYLLFYYYKFGFRIGIKAQIRQMVHSLQCFISSSSENHVVVLRSMKQYDSCAFVVVVVFARFLLNMLGFMSVAMIGCRGAFYL